MYVGLCGMDGCNTYVHRYVCIYVRMYEGMDIEKRKVYIMKELRRYGGLCMDVSMHV